MLNVFLFPVCNSTLGAEHQTTFENSGNPAPAVNATLKPLSRAINTEHGRVRTERRLAAASMRR